jgi:hypothetical protein
MKALDQINEFILRINSTVYAKKNEEKRKTYSS